MTRFWLRLVLTIAGIVLGLAAVTQVMARLAWDLSGAGEVSLSRLRDLEAPPQPDPAAAKTHSVREWAGPRRFREAPMLRKLVEAGSLDSAEKRLPEDPLVIVPPERIGPYGGDWPNYGTSPQDISIQLERLTYPALLRWGPMFREVLPNVAREWTVEDDGRVYTFRLRRGIRWSDGHPLTADDVMFWYECVLNDKTLTPVLPSELQPGGEPVRLTKLDDYTIRFAFKEPFGLFLPRVASTYGFHMFRYAKHYMRQFHPKHTPKEDLARSAREAGFGTWDQLFQDRWDWRNPECPRLWAWTVKEPPPARPIVFERNPYYWKVDPEGNQLPYIDRVTFFMLDRQAISLRIIKGEIGMQYRHVESEDRPMLMQNRKRGGYRAKPRLTTQGGTHLLCVNLNHRDPVLRKIFEDRRFRIALSHAIHRQEISEAFFFGQAEPRQVAPPPESAFYDPEYEKAYIEYRPDIANRMLDEMGLAKRNRAGIRLRPDGEPLRITIEATSVFFKAELLELVAHYWTEVGVQTDVKMVARQLEWERRRAGMLDVGVWGGGDELNPVLDPTWFFPTGPSSLMAPKYGLWFSSRGERGLEPRGDIRRCMEIYWRIQATPDRQEQIDLFREIIDLNRKNLWVIGTVSAGGGIGVLVKNDFHNVPDISVAGWPSPGNTAPECFSIGGE